MKINLLILIIFIPCALNCMDTSGDLIPTPTAAYISNNVLMLFSSRQVNKSKRLHRSKPPKTTPIDFARLVHPKTGELYSVAPQKALQISKEIFDKNRKTDENIVESYSVNGIFHCPYYCHVAVTKKKSKALEHLETEHTVKRFVCRDCLVESKLCFQANPQNINAHAREHGLLKCNIIDLLNLTL